MNARHQRFVDEYLIDLNGARAVTAAGFATKYPAARASKLLQVQAIKDAVGQAMVGRSKRTRINQDRVLEELGVLAYSNIHDYVVDDDGNVSLREGVEEEAMRAVSSIKRKRRVIPQENGDPIVEVDVEIRLWSKPDALRMSGQHLGMFGDREPSVNPQDVARAVRDALKAMDSADGLDAAA